jgi:signal transduction histidine kinase
LGKVRLRGRQPAVDAVKFVAAGLIAVLVLSAGALLVARRTATAEAVNDARDLAELAGQSIVGPLITKEVLAGDPGALQRLDAVVRQRVLGRSIVRVKVWSTEGRVVYSDEPRLSGQVFSLDRKEVALFSSGHIKAGVSDLADKENAFERQFKKLLEVYVGIPSPGGQPVLFEAYFRFTTVDATAHRVWVLFMPVVIGALAVLFVVQIPLAWSLTRRLRDSQRQRERLLQRALDASEHERTVIAADLHDGVVQGLAGASYSLSALAERADSEGLQDMARQASLTALRLREWMRELRSLVVSIAPPKLHEEGLAAALSDVAATARSRGVAVNLRVPDNLQLSPATESLVYRVAQEAVRNTLAHADATEVTIGLRVDQGGVVHLEVGDNGVGIQPLAALPRDGDHLGLRLLAELVGEAGGRFDVTTGAEGTTVAMKVLAG